MYIPSWLLIVLIIVGGFYYLNRKGASNHGNTNSTENQKSKKDWLEGENWKNEMLIHLAKFPKRTGRSRPTYNEMLELDEDEFKAWLFVKAESDNQEELLQEMIEHEEDTGSFAKTSKPNGTEFEQVILDLFKREKSDEVAGILRKLCEVTDEHGLNDVDGSSTDLIKTALWAKGTSDFYKLGDKIEAERVKNKPTN